MEEDDTETGEQLTLFKGGFFGIGGQLIGKLSGFVFVMLVTRFVTQEVYGSFVLAVSVITFIAGIASLNLFRSLDYFIPRLLEKGRVDESRRVFWKVMISAVILSLFASVLIFLFRNEIARIFNEPNLALVLSILVISVPLISARKVLNSFFKSVKNIKYYSLSTYIIPSISKFLFFLAFAILGLKLLALVTSYIISIILALFIGGILAARSTKILDLDLKSAKSYFLPEGGKDSDVGFSEIMDYSLPLVFAGVIYATLGQVDFWVIGYFSSSAMVGAYKVGYTLSIQIAIVLAGFRPIFKPVISGLSGNEDWSGVKEEYSRITRWIIMFTLPIIISLLIFPSGYLALFFTREYAIAAMALSALVIGRFINACMGLEGMMLEGLGMTRLTLLNTIAMLGTNVVLDILLVPLFGITGAGIATATTVSLGGVLGLFELYYFKNIHPYQKVGPLAKLFISAIPATLSGILLIKLFNFSDLVFALLIPISVTAVYLVFLLVLGGLEKSDKVLIKKTLLKIGISEENAERFIEILD